MRKILLILAVIVGIGSAAYIALPQQFSAGRIVQRCGEVENRPLCYTDAINEILAKRGLSDAFDVLANIYDADPSFAATCHAETHDLGKVAYQLFRDTGAVELSNKASYCGYGFYHGFMEALVVDTNDLQKARDFCSYIGRNVAHPPPAIHAEGSCYHGIGHGITDGTDPRLWGDAVGIVKPGLALCEKVAGGNTVFQRRCDTGVFNALANMFHNPKYKLSLGSDPYALCSGDAFRGIEREACFGQMNTQVHFLAHGDLAKTMAYVSAIKNVDDRSAALHEAAAFYIQVLKRRQQSLTPEELRVCNLPISNLRERCVDGFVLGIIEFGSPGQQYKEILGLCSASALPSRLRPPCYESLIKAADYYYPTSTLTNICRDVPFEFRNDVCHT